MNPIISMEDIDKIIHGALAIRVSVYGWAFTLPVVTVRVPTSS